VAIDNCPHTFHELATQVLPKYMQQMRAALAAPIRMQLFAEGKATAWRQMGRTTDFSGCYCLIESSEPFYVGISRKVAARLNQHFRGKTHFDASLAYAMACRCHPHDLNRGEAMLIPGFLNAFNQEQARIRAMDVAVIEIENPVELYLFEVYAALELRTALHNTFRTH
jgi:hypothetical protein